MSALISLASYARDQWLAGGDGETLASAIDASPVAAMPRAPIEPATMLDHARKVGGPGLRRLTFAQRGKLLRALAEALSANKEQLYELSYATGATRSDSAFDIEGGLGTLFFYASKSKAIPDAHILLDGAREAISKGNFAGQHVLSPLHGAAIHINAYNFPVWGMLEKLAQSLLAGVPAIVKPATATAWLAAAAFRIMIESGALPPGAMQLLLGPTGELFDHLEGEDIVVFTGSAATAAKLKSHPKVIQEAVRFTAEQDSLNASILGPDAVPGSPEFELFVKEVVREMTQKAGQKCTAIRRVLAPAPLIDEVESAIAARLAKITVGNPRSESVRMGALAGLQQRKDVLANLDQLRSETRLVTGAQNLELIDANSETGAFMAPTLLRCDNPLEASRVHELEAFGPVSTLMPYADVDEAVAIARSGKGSLVLSAFSRDLAAIYAIVTGAASSHGRLLIVDRDSAADSTGHGAVMPHLVHGGPGRAGGGEELGGLIGMSRYMQRSAIQASPTILDALSSL